MPDDYKTPQERYDAAHTVQVKLKLNTTTDADVLAALASADSKQGYIKRLIREDLRRKVDTQTDTASV